MNIWLINPYGPLPSEGWRDYSFITFGKTLAEAGHNVIWWTSNFSHHFKIYRSEGWKDIAISNGFIIRLVPTTRYSRNIGFGRIVRDFVFAARTYQTGKHQPAPDAIIYAESPLTMGYAGPALARHHKAALIYDQMDLWPELIVNVFPMWSRKLVNLCFSPVYWKRRKIYSELDGVIALAHPYMASVLKDIPVQSRPPSRIIYNGVDVSGFRANMVLPLSNALAAKFENASLKAVFAGSLGPSYDILNLLDVAQRMDTEGLDIRVYIAGDGPLKQKVVEAAARLSNLDYLGTLPPADLPRIYEKCDVGLSCYTARSNVEMPDKFYDYTAAGLAIVNSLGGEVSRWINADQSGIQYMPGDFTSLYEALVRLRDDPTCLRMMKRASFNAGSRFDSTVQHAALASLIEAAASQRKLKRFDKHMDRPAITD
jgi:glycosyltransferase involved in cell wall biosynthesis